MLDIQFFMHLQADLDNKRYAEMVADITEAERGAEELRNSVLPTSRLQLSFGLHIIVMMGTFFALGYYGLAYATRSQVWVRGAAKDSSRSGSQSTAN